MISTIGSRAETMKAALKVLGACAVFLSGTTVLQAQSVTVGDVHIEHPWARPLPAISKNGAVYMSIKNRGVIDDSLVSGSSPVSERVELHTHIHENGMMMMRPVEKIEVPAGGKAALAPGGAHLMLIGLNSPMTEGKEFPLTLRFEHAGEIELSVEVGQPQGDTKN